MIESIIPHRPPVPARGRDRRARAGPESRRPPQRAGGRLVVPRTLPGRPVMPGVLTIEAIAQCGAVAVLAAEENRGKHPVLRGHRRLPLQADRRAGRRARPRVRVPARARPDREGPGSGERRRRGRGRGDADRLHRQRGASDRASATPAFAISITGLGALRARPRARRTTSSRRSSTRRTSGSSSAPGSASGGSRPTTQALSDLALPAARDGAREGGPRPARTSTSSSCATVTPDMSFPSTRRDPRGHARRGRRRRLRPLGRLHRLHVRARAGVRDARVGAGAARARRRRRRALAASSTGTTARRVVLFGDGAGAVVLERGRPSRASSRFELGADGSGGEHLWLPGSGSRALRRRRQARVKMNGREVFKFATRILVQSAEDSARPAPA